jgi:NAD(P)-dependent dehydrogenase (short-subunit alcohol dehydrogenase family)
MQSLGPTYRALVIGASGSIGNAFSEALRSDPNCAHVSTLSRSSHPGFALEDEASIMQAAQALTGLAPFDLIIDATGALTIDGHGPEKHLGALQAQKLARAFEVNAIGPVLLLKHFSPLLGKDRSIYAKLSARVGSISDNKKGGWYGYRAAKAALNMLLQTAAIEIQRKRPQALVVALQPGTVQSPLSAPFSGGHDTISANESADGLLRTLDSLDVTSGAQFYDFKGSAVAW